MKIKLDDLINHRIAIVAGLLKRQIYRIISDRGIEITPDQWTILDYLWEENGLLIGELASKSRKDFANVTRIVEKLQKQGYVTKEKNKSDGRSYIVHYTDKSLAIKLQVEECQKYSLDISLKGVSEEEQAITFRTLEKIESNTLNYLEEVWRK